MYDVGALALLIYSGVTLVFTFPLILHLSSQLPYDLGDPLLTSAVLWWNAHAVPFTDRWWNGFGFFPAPGSTAFSADQLGASIISTPLQWLGATPVAAYNVLFLLSWPLSALAAHFCARTITGREDAAYVAGLAYGFNPVRVAHVEHLELLMAFGMPAALGALHRFVTTKRPIWAFGFAAALIVQALSSSYYALFFTVFFAMWIAWFVRPAEWRSTGPLVAAGAAAVAIVSPVFLGYSRIHELYGMQRKFEEVLTYSADVSSFVTASALSAAWGWTSHLNGGERQLFPGVTIAVVAAAGWVMARRKQAGPPDRTTLAARISLALAVVFAVIAASVAITGPFRLELGPVRISASDLFKPLSVAVGLGVVALALSRRIRLAFHRRSTLMFYLLAALVLMACSLGPEPTLMGRRILYEPPYAWLMRLPFFSDTIRVPARFGMLAALALSLAASIAFAQLTASSKRRRMVFAAVVIGILADGWMRAFPLAAAPAGFTVPAEARPVSAILELPLGDVIADTAAMYRVTVHQTRTVNGYNGYEPLYYRVMRLGLADRDDTVLEAVSSFGPLLVAVNARSRGADDWIAFASRQPGSRRLAGRDGWHFIHVPQQKPAPTPPCTGSRVPIRTATFNGAPINVSALSDQDAMTRWISPAPQREGDSLVLDLGFVQQPCSLTVSRGAEGELYPRGLAIATSVDGHAWTPVSSGRMGGAAVHAVLRNPVDAQTPVALPGDPARFVRLQLTHGDRVYQWAIAGVTVATK